MAEYHGSEAIVSFDTPGGSLTAYHEGIRSVTHSGEKANSQYATLGTNRYKKTSVSSKIGLTGSMVVVKDTTANSAYQDLHTYFHSSTYDDTAFTLRIQSPDGETGSDQEDMEIKILNINDNNHDADSGDPATVTVEFGIHGSYAKTVIGS